MTTKTLLNKVLLNLFALGALFVIAYYFLTFFIGHHGAFVLATIFTVTGFIADLLNINTSYTHKIENECIERMIDAYNGKTVNEFTDFVHPVYPFDSSNIESHHSE
jgi:hypothetical protein